MSGFGTSLGGGGVLGRWGRSTATACTVGTKRMTSRSFSAPATCSRHSPTTRGTCPAQCTRPCVGLRRSTVGSRTLHSQGRRDLTSEVSWDVQDWPRGFGSDRVLPSESGAEGLGVGLTLPR